MKEVTYEDWKKNPTPREMWVWDYDKNNKKQEKVIYFINNVQYPAVVETKSKSIIQYRHCAEIEKSRLMTQRELSRWLREKPTREYKFRNDSYIFSYYEYKEGCENEDVSEKIRIRENYGEWREPLVEE